MKLIAVCGSARKQGNTAKMLQQVIEGAQSVGAETELVHLFDLNYKDCISCFSCKLKNGTSFGHCNQHDELKPLLERIEQCDVIVLGSPVYYGNLSGQMRSFTDRLLFQYLVYGATGRNARPKNFKTALIATMNVNDELFDARGFKDSLVRFTEIMSRTLGSCELLTLTNTVQFDDYSKYVYLLPDKEEKSSRVENISAHDLQKAFDLGVRLITS